MKHNLIDNVRRSLAQYKDGDLGAAALLNDAPNLLETLKEYRMWAENLRLEAATLREERDTLVRKVCALLRDHAEPAPTPPPASASPDAAMATEAIRAMRDIILELTRRDPPRGRGLTAAEEPPP